MSCPVSFDAIVAQLVGHGFPREKAEAKARELHPELAQAHDVAAVKRASVLEKAEQSAITKMARAIGITVRSTSQARASKVAPGLPDLILAKRDVAFFAFWETKRQIGGELSTAQIEFLADADAANIACGSGDRYAFHRWLTARGLIAPPIPQD